MFMLSFSFDYNILLYALSFVLLYIIIRCSTRISIININTTSVINIARVIILMLVSISLDVLYCD